MALAFGLGVQAFHLTVIEPGDLGHRLPSGLLRNGMNRADVHQPPDVRFPADVHDVFRTDHIDVEHFLIEFRGDGHDPGRMDHYDLTRLVHMEKRYQAVRITDVPLTDLKAAADRRRYAVSRQGETPHLFPTGEEFIHDRMSQMAIGPRHQIQAFHVHRILSFLTHVLVIYSMPQAHEQSMTGMWHFCKFSRPFSRTRRFLLRENGVYCRI